MYLFMFGWSFFISTTIMMIFGLSFSITCYSFIGACLFGGYLIYDVQTLMIGDKNVTYGPDDYILATINIYLDIINLFLYILRILGERDRNNN